MASEVLGSPQSQVLGRGRGGHVTGSEPMRFCETVELSVISQYIPFGFSNFRVVFRILASKEI